MSRSILIYDVDNNNFNVPFISYLQIASLLHIECTVYGFTTTKDFLVRMAEDATRLFCNIQ